MVFKSLADVTLDKVRSVRYCIGEAGQMLVEKKAWGTPATAKG